MHRAASILRAVAEGRATTVSSLARELDIRKTTCHSIVHELLEARLLDRVDGTGELCPGHALLSLGFSCIGLPLRMAGQASKLVVRLSTLFDASCAAYAMCGGELLVAGRCDPDRPVPQRFDTPIGLSAPAIPPAGGTFVAWASDDAIEAWLDRLGPGAAPNVRSRYRAMLAATRNRGYAIILEEFSPGRTAFLNQMAAALHDDGELSGLLIELNERLERQEAELRHLEVPQSRVQTIAAPVFDASGDVVLSLVLMNFPTTVLVETLAPYAEELLRATASLTNSFGGVFPGARPATDDADAELVQPTT